jgi:hypothetical protein
LNNPELRLKTWTNEVRTWLRSDQTPRNAEQADRYWKEVDEILDTNVARAGE